MKKKILQIFILLILFSAAVLLIYIGEGRSTSGYEGYYEYPDPKGKSDLLVVSECRIPEDILKAMTDEQLAQAVADFPRLLEVGVASSLEYGVEVLPEKCDAYRELLTRKNAKDALISKLRELYENEALTFIVGSSMGIIILYEKQFEGTLTEEEIAFVKQFC